MVTTELAVQAAAVDLERQALLLLHALAAMDAAKTDFAAFRVALEKVVNGAAGLRQQVVSRSDEHERTLDLAYCKYA